MRNSVNTGVSDIFFNRDFNLGHTDYTTENLKEPAEMVLTELRCANTPDLPTAEELVEDFFERL